MKALLNDPSVFGSPFQAGVSRNEPPLEAHPRKTFQHLARFVPVMPLLFIAVSSLLFLSAFISLSMSNPAQNDQQIGMLSTSVVNRLFCHRTGS
jgi:hypothetical protein